MLRTVDEDRSYSHQCHGSSAGGIRCCECTALLLHPGQVKHATNVILVKMM